MKIEGIIINRTFRDDNLSLIKNETPLFNEFEVRRVLRKQREEFNNKLKQLKEKEIKILKEDIIVLENNIEMMESAGCWDNKEDYKRYKQIKRSLSAKRNRLNIIVRILKKIEEMKK